jgi:hypothetical protein
MNVNGGLGRMTKVEAVAYFKVAYYPSICVEGMRKSKKTLCKDRRSSAEKRLWYLANTDHE